MFERVLVNRWGCAKRQKGCSWSVQVIRSVEDALKMTSVVKITCKEYLALSPALYARTPRAAGAGFPQQQQGLVPVSHQQFWWLNELAH